MKKSILALLFIIFVSGCGKDASREYTYVEFSRSKDIFYNEWRVREAKPVKIKAENDTLAYIEAYTKFCISQKNYEATAGKTGKYDETPVYFKLFDKNDMDIVTTLKLNNIDSIQNTIKEKVAKE